MTHVVTECLCEESSLKTGKPVSEKNTMTVDMRCPAVTRCPAIESWHAQCSCVVPLFRRISHVWFDVYINCIIVIIIRITIVIINISRGIITKDQWNCRLLFTIMIWCLTWGFASSSETDFNVCQSNHLAYIRMSGCKSIKYNYILLQCNLVDPVQRSENWLLCLQTRQWVENTKHLHEFHLLKNVPFCLLIILWKVPPLPFRQGGETWDEHGECGRHQQRGKGGFKEIIITIIIIFNFDQFQNTRWFLWKHEIEIKILPTSLHSKWMTNTLPSS